MARRARTAPRRAQQHNGNHDAGNHRPEPLQKTIARFRALTDLEESPIGQAHGDDLQSRLIVPGAQLEHVRGILHGAVLQRADIEVRPLIRNSHQERRVPLPAHANEERLPPQRGFFGNDCLI